MNNISSLTKTDFVNRIIDAENLDMVIGGTFTADKFPIWAYEDAGFTVEQNFFAKNKYIKDGITYDHDQANAIMASMGYELVRKLTSYTTTRIFVRHNGKDRLWR